MGGAGRMETLGSRMEQPSEEVTGKEVGKAVPLKPSAAEPEFTPRHCWLLVALSPHTWLWDQTLFGPTNPGKRQPWL